MADPALSDFSDVDALARNHRAMKARGVAMPLFDYGPSTDELRGRSQADTGLAPPIQPQWTRTQSPLSIAAE